MPPPHLTYRRPRALGGVGAAAFEMLMHSSEDAPEIPQQKHHPGKCNSVSRIAKRKKHWAIPIPISKVGHFGRFPPPFLGRGCPTHGNKINFQSPFSFPEAIFAPLYKGRRALFSFAKNVLSSYSSFPSPATRQELRKGEGGGVLNYSVPPPPPPLGRDSARAVSQSRSRELPRLPRCCWCFPGKRKGRRNAAISIIFHSPAAAVARLCYCSVQSMKQSASDSSFCFRFPPASITATLYADVMTMLKLPLSLLFLFRRRRRRFEAREGDLWCGIRQLPVVQCLLPALWAALF